MFFRFSTEALPVRRSATTSYTTFWPSSRRSRSRPSNWHFLGIKAEGEAKPKSGTASRAEAPYASQEKLP